MNTQEKFITEIVDRPDPDAIATITTIEGVVEAVAFRAGDDDRAVAYAWLSIDTRGACDREKRRVYVVEAGDRRGSALLGSWFERDDSGGYRELRGSGLRADTVAVQRACRAVLGMVA